MCGIIGGNSFSSTKRVVKGLHSMMHRGTDGNVILKFDSGNHLSHNRLSIQDLSEKANQPMVSDCGNYYLAFNGELWKSTFKKFNKKLRKKYNFKTEKSDSELLLYFLVENIDNLAESLNKIEGMFCFSFYDFKNDTTYLGRDFIGRLPLYYCYQDGKFAYSSEVKGLTIGIDKSYYKIDVKSKRFKSSEFKDREVIHAVLPGTVLKFSPDKFITDNHSMNSTRWFDFKPKFDEKKMTYYPRTEEEFEKYDLEDKGLEYYTKGFRDRLEKAVDEETISDVPICTILSGGIDSTIITYLLSKQYPNMEAFVVNVNPTRKSKLKDDLYYARIAAKEFGIKLHEVNVDREDIERVLEESIWASETHKWTQISPAVAQLFLSWEVRDKGFKVVFGGEGADEIFASYGDVKRFCWHKPIWWHQKRVNLVNNLHKSNLVRTNKAMMYGGKVELRTPFLNKELIDFGLHIPTKYRDEKEGKGSIMKYVLRKAFEGDISDELLWRPKKTFQVGCHTDYLKKEQDNLDNLFEKLFVNRKLKDAYLYRNFGHIKTRIKEIENTKNKA
mgnify:FL=1|tara:strand:+ start:216 stop:1886 length:1671 start_codon:yes stop_codon:yes gene_type:complete